MVSGAKLATLGLLVLTGVAAVPRDSSSPKLYVCQDGQCVLNDKGLPLSECEVACIPPPVSELHLPGRSVRDQQQGAPKGGVRPGLWWPGPGAAASTTSEAEYRAAS